MRANHFRLLDRTPKAGGDLAVELDGVCATLRLNGDVRLGCVTDNDVMFGCVPHLNGVANREFQKGGGFKLLTIAGDGGVALDRFDPGPIGRRQMT